MSKTKLRKLEVDNEKYLWKLNHYYDVWEGVLRVYVHDNKAGWLEVHYSFEDLNDSFLNHMSATYEWTGEQGFNIHEPKTVVRIVRYARRKLAWNPLKNNTPLVIENGYQLLRDLGYQSFSINDEDV